MLTLSHQHFKPLTYGPGNIDGNELLLSYMSSIDEVGVGPTCLPYVTLVLEPIILWSSKFILSSPFLTVLGFSAKRLNINHECP